MILDSANDFFSGAQLNWLEHELASAKEYVFVFTHTNIFTDNNLPLLDLQQQTDTRERSRLVAMLSGRAAIVFSGHVHNRISTVIRNTNYQSIEDFISYKTFARVYVANNNSTIVFFNLNKL